MQNLVALARIGSLAALVAAGSAQSLPELFPLPLHTAGGKGGEDFLVLDADRDGALDILVAGQEWSGSRLYTLRGRGDGTFAQPSEQWLPHSPEALATGDFDSDGMVDIAAVSVSGSGGAVLILRGQAHGGFEAARHVDLDVHPTRVLVADIDEDGHLDLLVNNEVFGGDYGARLLRGRGDGTFSAALDLAIDDRLLSVQLVDVDLDGHLDLAAITRIDLSAAPCWLRTYTGNGHGRFTARSMTPIEYASTELAYADFDGDGRLDAVVSAGTTYTSAVTESSVNVLPTLADGTPGAPITLWTGAMPGRVAVLDLDSDGRLDLSVPYRSRTSNAGGLAIVRGLGGFAFAPSQTVRIGTPLSACHAADLDRDGDIDIAGLTYRTVGAVAVVRASSPGEFEAALPLNTLASDARDIAAGDLNGDGRSDVAIVRSPGVVERWHGTGDGQFSSEGPLAATGELHCVVVHDFSGDGRAEIAAIASGSTWLSPTTLSVWRATAVGGVVRDDYLAPPGAEAVVCCDLDGDVYVDLAVSGFGCARLFHARADGTFERGPRVALPPYSPRDDGFTAGDFDGDGLADLAATGFDPLVVAFGRGGDAFDVVELFPELRVWVLLGVGDLDMDGCDDLVVSCWPKRLSPATTDVLFGRADRTFDRVRLGQYGKANCAGIADFNDNGVPDVLLLEPGQISVLTGDGTRRFDPRRSYCAGQPTRGAFADFNGDGRIDCAAALYGESAFSVFLRR